MIRFTWRYSVRHTGTGNCFSTGAFPGKPPFRLRGECSQPSVWTEFSQLSQVSSSINLGQGFPSWLPPKFVQEAVRNAISSPDPLVHQYCRSAGHPVLVDAIAKVYSPALKKTIQPLNEVVVSSGATEAIYITLQAFCEEGDEVIVLEPAFDIYKAQAQMAGAKPIGVPLRYSNSNAKDTKDISFCEDELRSAFSTKTRAIILNTPHNPTGKIFNRKELDIISTLVNENPRCIVISDEVYENIFCIYLKLILLYQRNS